MLWFVEQESNLRLGIFLGMLVVMMALEAMWPKRVRREERRRRWPINLGIVVIDAVVVRFLVPLLPVAAAGWASVEGFGLLNLWQPSLWLAIAIAFVALDGLIYAQHLVFHRVPILWRLHRMHHTDLDLDATSGIRFHPIEIVLSVLIKIAAVVVLGAPVEAVILFEIVLNATSLFNHANVALPKGLDAAVRLIVVTPDMHRVHHSVHPYETNSNYGFNLTWWDRLFGTYRAQPDEGHDGMTIGLYEYQDPADLGLPDLLVQPFRDVPSEKHALSVPTEPSDRS